MNTIKKAAEITGLTPKCIRDYEKMGLISAVGRSEAKYRLYDEESINRLHLIKYYRSLKFPLQEIFILLKASPGEIESAMERQLKFLDEQLNDYHYAKAMLCSTLYQRNRSGNQNDDPCRRIAVIAIDLQNEMLEGGVFACNRILTILPPLRKLFVQARQAGIPVIYICDCHKKGDPELEIWDDHMMEGTFGAQIIDDVAPGEKDFIVQKNLFNGFINTELQNTLDMLGVDTLLFTGWRTNVCVAQTAIEAFYRGFKVAIAVDGVNSQTEPEHVFGMSLMGINYDFPVYTCAEAIKSLLEDNKPE